MSDPLRVTVWGENVHEREEERGARALPRRHARDDRGGPRAVAGRPRARAHRDARAARARAHRGRAGRHRRADLVGPHRARPGRRRVVERVHAAVLGGMGLLALHSAHYSKIFQRLLGTLVQPALAQRRRARAGVDRRPRAPDRRRRPAPDRHRRARDVRRALRHPGARRARLRQLVRRRRGVPRRLLLSRAAPGGSSTSARATRTTRSTTTPTCSGSSPTRSSGPRRVRTSRAPLPGSPMAPRGWFSDRAISTAAARRRRRPRLGRPAAPRRLRRASGHRRSSALAGPGGRARGPSSPRQYGIEHAVADWKDLLDGRGPRRGQRLRPDVPARADRDRGPRARHPRALREADRARRGRGASAWSGPPARPTACSTSPSTTASAATSRSSRR